MRQTFSFFMPRSRTVFAILFMTIFCLPIMAKGWSSFKSNPEYIAGYPDNWYRTDPSSNHFNVNSTEAKEGDTPANIQVRISFLTDEEAALSWQEFVDHQLELHIKYLDDNWLTNPTIHEADTLGIDGADLGFHLRTDLPDGEEPAVLINDYARKGNKLYIFRFYCPMAKYEKYLTDYYTMREGFELR